MIRLKGEAFPQWKVQDWRREVIQLEPETGYSHEQTAPGEGLSATAGHTTGKLHEWKPGEMLPPLSGHSHLGGWSRSVIQRTIYPTLLPLLDRVRPGWPAGGEPNGGQQ